MCGRVGGCVLQDSKYCVRVPGAVSEVTYLNDAKH